MGRSRHNRNYNRISARDNSRKLEPGEEIDALSDLARQVGLDMRLTRSYAHSREFFEHELDQLERSTPDFLVW
jgi:hypothetical protein